MLVLPDRLAILLALDAGVGAIKGRVNGVERPLVYFKGDFCDVKSKPAKKPVSKPPKS